MLDTLRLLRAASRSSRATIEAHQSAPSAEGSAQKLEELRPTIEPLLGPGVELDILLVPNIPPEPGGKFRVARSLVKPEPTLVDAAPTVGRLETGT